MEAQYVTRAKELLRRKEELGKKAASYRILGERAGCSSTTVARVLKEIKGDFPINRTLVMDDVEKVLDEIEVEVAMEQQEEPRKMEIW